LFEGNHPGSVANVAPQKVPVDVDGRTLTLSNLEKVLYPDTGFTKGEVIDYYARIADVMLPHLRGRPATFRRFPNGVDGKSFFEKNAPQGKPDWVRTVRLPVPGSTMNRETIDFVVVEDRPTLVWAANLASLEVHVPQWKVGPRGAAHDPDLLVLDLDPGPPATIVECCAVALLLREILVADGLEPVAKTSGSKGMQLYAALRETPSDGTSTYAHDLAQRLESEHPDLVVSRMTKTLRPSKVFVDWSQNNAAKTTVAPYSLRARPRPTVSTPLTWDDVDACREPEDLVFTAPEVLARVERDGDLFESLLRQQPPPLP
jgi:bifunctional non-homologous end joining protein LigD